MLANTDLKNPYLCQKAKGNRIVFVFPYLGKTEVSQALAEDIKCSDEERSYLLDIYNNNSGSRFFLRTLFLALVAFGRLFQVEIAI